MYGAYRRRGGHIIIAGICDHGNGVGPWGQYKRFRDHPLTRIRGYGGHRVYAPFPTSLLNRAPYAGLGGNRCRIVCPEHLANTPALLSERLFEKSPWLPAKVPTRNGHC